MNSRPVDIVATAVSVNAGMIELELHDGSRHAFPIHYYPRLCSAAPAQLSQVQLRVGGRALRWDLLDEDIWIADALMQNYPSHPHLSVADPAPHPLTKRGKPGNKSP